MSARSSLRRRINTALAHRTSRTTTGRVLLYHHIRESADPIDHVPPGVFRNQLDWLRESSLEAVPVGVAVDRGFPVGLVAISFDDGYVSAVEACAELLSRGWSATLFVVPQWVEERRGGILSWSQIGELARAGIELGAHGLDHRPLCDRDASAMSGRLVRARALIEDRTGVEPIGLSYPHGLAPRRAREAARQAGFSLACTTVPGRNDVSTERLALHRNEVLGTDSRARFLLGKLGGSDDWMAPVRRLENAIRCGR